MRTAFSSTAFTRFENLRTLARRFVELYKTQNIIVGTTGPFFIEDDGDLYPNASSLVLVPAPYLHLVEGVRFVWEELSVIASSAVKGEYSETELRLFEIWAGYFLAQLESDLETFDEDMVDTLVEYEMLN